MLKRAYGRSDNRGASLVLVIISLLFVGIIAAAILRMTVGNNRAVDTASRSSSTFYTTENALDDLKLYLQKFANEAATKAYAKQLSQMGVVGTVDKAQFDYDFKVYLKEILENGEWTKLQNGNGSEDNVSVISRGKITGTNGYTITIGDYAVNYQTGLKPDGSNDEDVPAAITGVQVAFLDSGENNGYQNTIYTDIVFSADMPKMTWKNTEKTFDYDADKYVIISNGNLNLNNLNGTIKGSLYAKNNINVNADSTINLYSKYVIAGMDINVLKGTLKFGGFEKALLDLNKDTTTFTEKTQDNENIWCNNLAIERGSMEIGNGKIYVKDDLSLNGDNTEFTVKSGSTSGKIVGFSSDNGNDGGLVDYDKSSAIIVNGAAAKVDLTSINSIVMAGTAYTEIPKEPGHATDIDYFVQGESITYRTLQSMYMVDAGKLYYMSGSNKVYIGRNPMSSTEYNLWKTAKNADIPSNISNLLVSGEPFRVKAVQYPVGGSTNEFYYIYWNFKNVQDAVKYFYGLNDTLTIAQKVAMIGSGYIKLPAESKIDTAGNVIKYNPGSTDYFISKKDKVQGLSSEGLQECIDARISYNNLKSSLAKDKISGTDLFSDALFAAGEISLADTAAIYTLNGPQTEWTDTDSDGKTITYGGYCLKTTGTTKATDPTAWTYKLVTGKNIKISTVNDYSNANLTCFKPATGVKYVVVTQGDVTMDAACDFNGIIFAKGDVTVIGNSTFNCFGNFYRTVQKEGEAATSQYVTEFRALLDVKGDSDTSPNEILRRIFGVSSGTGSSTGTKIEKDMGIITIDKYKKE